MLLSATDGKGREVCSLQMRVLQTQGALSLYDNDDLSVVQCVLLHVCPLLDAYGRWKERVYVCVCTLIW